MAEIKCRGVGMFVLRSFDVFGQMIVRFFSDCSCFFEYLCRIVIERKRTDEVGDIQNNCGAVVFYTTAVLALGRCAAQLL